MNYVLLSRKKWINGTKSTQNSITITTNIPILIGIAIVTHLKDNNTGQRMPWRCLTYNPKLYKLEKYQKVVIGIGDVTSKNRKNKFCLLPIVQLIRIK